MNNQIPILYDQINCINGFITPSSIHVKDSQLTRFFAKYLMQKVLSVYQWEVPEHWSKDYFLYTLFGYGYVAIIKTDKFGVIPQHCSLLGQDVFYRPTNAVISNHLLTGILQPKINKQCTLIKLQPDYGSVMDLIWYYAGMMALSSESAVSNLINSKLSYIGIAGTKTKGESLKKLYDQVASGNPAVFMDEKLLDKNGKIPFEMFNQNVGQNYIVDRILGDLRKWENMFNTEVGISNANTDKKERLITAEVEANEQETTSKASLWLEEMQEAVRKTNVLFGTDIKVDWRNKPDIEKEGGEIDGDNA